MAPFTRAQRAEAEAAALRACEWLEALRNGPASENEAFATWLLESRRNVRNYLLATAVGRELQNMDASAYDVQTLLQDAGGKVVTITPQGSLPHGATGGTRWHGFRARMAAAKWRLAAAAGLVILMASALLAPAWNAERRVYQTGRGEQHSFKLSDGSTIHLNAQSRVKQLFNDDVREFRLDSGEALFVVARDATRPFRVNAGSATIQAVGTQFNVKRFDSGTQVSVLEGKVKITEIEAPDTAAPSGGTADLLEAGEQALIAGDGRVLTRQVPDAHQVVAWRERRLVFRNDALADVAAEFNRYNAAQIRVEGDDARRRRFTGVLDADDPAALLRILGSEGDLEIDTAGNETVISARRQ